MVTARAFRLTTLVALALGAALLPVEPAAGSICIKVDPRVDLARADAAFIGSLCRGVRCPARGIRWDRRSS